MDEKGEKLNIDELDKLVGDVPAPADVSVDDILAEYSGGTKTPAAASPRHVAYMPETDRELEREIKNVVASVMSDGERRRELRKKSDQQTIRQNRRDQKFETQSKQTKRSKKQEAGKFDTLTRQGGKRPKEEKVGEETVRLPVNAVREMAEQTKKKRSGKVIYMSQQSVAFPPVPAQPEAELAEKPEKREKAQRHPTKPAAPEMSLKDAAKKYRHGATMGVRAWLAAICCAVLMYISAAPELALPSPTIAGYSGVILFICLNVMVALLCLDRLVQGIAAIFMLRMDANSLVAAANVLSIADGVYLLLTKSEALPVSAVCATALVISLVGERKRRKALMLTFKTGSAVSDPYVVTAETAHYCGRPAIIKSETGTLGAVPTALGRDGVTRVMRVLAPVLLFVCPLAAILAGALGKAEGEFLHLWSILAAASLPAAAGLGYSVPFLRLARKLSRSGSAVMGYRGAKNISRQNCVVITDRDVFPTGFVTLNGMKLMEGRSSEKIISCTAILVRASGSDLARIFTDLMNEHMGVDRRLEDFEFMDGGFGGVIGGEYVMCGTAQFMRERGVTLPEGMKVKNAVFTAFGTSLAGVFALNYTASPTVATALNRMIYGGSVPLLMSTDFNVTPQMLAAKFKLHADDIETREPQDIYAEPEIFGAPAAVVCREGLPPFSDAVTGGRRLVKAVRRNVIFTLIASVLGCLLCFWLMFLGAQNTLTCGKLAVYMLAWLIPVWLSSCNVNV